VYKRVSLVSGFQAKKFGIRKIKDFKIGVRRA